MIRNIFVTFFIFLLLSVSLLENSINYKLSLSDASVDLEILNKKVRLPFDSNLDKIAVKIFPQERYSTSQYLIQDKGFVKNSFKLFSLLLFRKKNSEIWVESPIRSYLNFIHFNPFRSSVIISSGKSYYRLEVNIPDASLEVWDQSKKIENFIVKPPWLNLIVYPIISSLMISCFIYYFLRLLFKTKISSILNQQNPTKIFKSSNIDKVLGLGFFITGALITGYIFFKVFNAIPGFGDEMNYLIQAKIFAAGKFFVKEPSNPEFFKVGWMDIFSGDKKLWNFHPPGNSLILMFGQLLSIDWITIPIVGGLILLTQYFLALNLFENRLFALIHIIVITTSHFFLSLASTYMAHAPSLLFISLFYLFFIKFVKEKKVSLLYFASASIGFAFVIRPLSAVLASIVPLSVLLIFLLKEKRIHYISLLGTLIVGFMISSFIFLYSYKVSGRWTLPYLIKGPEIGLTLKVRWLKGWDFRLTNLYRNSNEFQNRVHSLGYLFNYVFFLFPVFWLKKNKNRLWIIGGYLSFFLYLVIHSFLHWYGWKWEPRMIYDISFVFFLLTSYGLGQCCQLVSSNRLRKYFIVIILFLITIPFAISNLRHRFQTEYRNYNINPTEVRDTINEKRISQAIIFLTNDKIFAPYSPKNSLNFDGGIIYALSQNEDYDYKLITKFPEKDIYYTSNGISLEKKSNFYKKDIFSLLQDLKEKYSNKNIIIVIPWLKMVDTSVHDILPGETVDSDGFIDLIKKDSIDKNTVIVLLDHSINLAKVINIFYNSIPLNNLPYDSQLKIIEIKSKNDLGLDKIPFLKMRCYRGTDWNGNIIKDDLVTSVNISGCLGEYLSIEWLTYFDLEVPKNIVFYLESDDNSEIIIDNKSVLTANQNGKQTVGINLDKGNHTLIIKFNNGPDGEYLNIGTIDTNNKEIKLSIDSKDLYFYLPQKLWN